MEPPATSSLSCRALLGGTGLGAAWTAAEGAELAGPEPPATSSGPVRPAADFTDHSAALQPERVVAFACQFCNSNCRLHVHLKAGRVLEVRGEEADPVQAGQLCVKASFMP